MPNPRGFDVITYQRLPNNGCYIRVQVTSTLEQGINMPFDIVYIDRLDSQKHLAIKNLIGRAGRSSEERKIDFVIVIIASTKVAKLRKQMGQTVMLNMQSQLDDNKEHDADYNDFKDAILNVFRRLSTIEYHQLEMMQHHQESDKRIDEVFRKLDEGSIQPKQGIFYDGQIYDAYTFVSDLVKSAKRSIDLVPYSNRQIPI